MLIAVEGLPGAGKTTCARLVAERLHAVSIEETTGDHPFLSQVYDAADRDDLTIELSFLLVHANPYRRLGRRDVAVSDYSPAKDLLFAEDMLSESDLRLFREVYAHLYEGCALPDVVVYLRASPELCLRRVRTRLDSDPDRTFEAGLTLERLRRMADRYDRGVGRLGQTCLTLDVGESLRPDALARSVVTLLHDHLSVESL